MIQTLKLRIGLAIILAVALLAGYGVITTTIAPATSADKINALALQSDGKIIAAGSASDGSGADFALARYNTNGALDASFGAGGKVITSIDKDDNALAILIQPDGKIILGGHTYNTKYDFGLARYWR